MLGMENNREPVTGEVAKNIRKEVENNVLKDNDEIVEKYNKVVGALEKNGFEWTGYGKPTMECTINGNTVFVEVEKVPFANVIALVDSIKIGGEICTLRHRISNLEMGQIDICIRFIIDKFYNFRHR